MYDSSHIVYYHLCHRKLWLHNRQLRMEDNSSDVAMGKLLDNTTYQRRARRWRQLRLGNLVIDHFDPVSREVLETKKSSKLERAHVAQLKYYLYRMEEHGIHGASGILEYPSRRKRKRIELTEADKATVIPGWEAEIGRIVGSECCPEVIKKSYCRACAFYDFCFA